MIPNLTMRGSFYRWRRVGRMLTAAALLVTGTDGFASEASPGRSKRRGQISRDQGAPPAMLCPGSAAARGVEKG